MSATKIHYISTNTVRAMTHIDKSLLRVELTPWDLSHLHSVYIQRGFLFHKPQTQHFPVIDHLISSLSRTLDYFVPLTGRLATETHDDHTISYYIDCNGAGAELVHAVVDDVTISKIVDPVYVPDIVQSLFFLNGVKNLEGKLKPLLVVQVTELVDGIFIGYSVNHLVVDGISFWHFINSWSKISSDFNHIPRLPILKRWFLNDTDCPIRFPSSAQDQLLESYPHQPFLYQRIFHFTPQKMAQLKAKANEERETNQVSSLQALLGHIWKATTRARCLDSNQEVSCRVIAGNRERLNPRLPEEYFGNSIQSSVATCKAGDLLEQGLGWAAGLLNEVISSHNDTAIRSYLQNWMKKPVLYHSGKMDPYCLLVGGSPRFNMYGNDFGWGQPVAVLSGNRHKFDGKMIVNPGRVEGSVEVEACLLPETLIAMGEDPEFMEYVT